MLTRMFLAALPLALVSWGRRSVGEVWFWVVAVIWWGLIWYGLEWACWPINPVTRAPLKVRRPDWWWRPW